MDDINQLINNMHRDLEFGTVVFYVKKHEGKVTNLDATKLYTTKTPGGSKEAVVMVTSMIKAMHDTQQDGSMTFTLDFHKGEATKVIMQDNKKNRLN